MRMLLLWLDTMTMTVMVMIMIVVGSMIMMIYNKWLHSWVTNSPVCYYFMCWLVDVVLILHKKKNNIYIFYVNCLVWHLFIFSLFHFFYFLLILGEWLNFVIYSAFWLVCSFSAILGRKRRRLLNAFIDWKWSIEAKNLEGEEMRWNKKQWACK